MQGGGVPNFTREVAHGLAHGLAHGRHRLRRASAGAPPRLLTMEVRMGAVGRRPPQPLSCAG